MKAFLFWCSLTAALVFAAMIPGRAAATLQQQIDQSEVNVGDEVVFTLTVQNGSFSRIQFPHVEGLQVAGTNTATSMTFNNGSPFPAPRDRGHPFTGDSCR